MLNCDARKVQAWRHTPIILISAFVHVIALALVVLQPNEWPWALGTVAANHLVIGCGVLTPCSSLLGANLTRLPKSAIQRGEICLTFDDGPDPQITPRVLDLLDRHRAKASFFCIGKKAAAHPELLSEIVRRGHSVENHSDTHSYWFAFYGISRLRGDIGVAQSALVTGAGHAPLFFRAPVGFRGPLLDRVLEERSLRYVSWTRRGFDGVSTNPEHILRRLTDGLAAGDILLLHDRMNASGDAPILTVLPELLDRAAALGLRAVSLPAALHDESGV